MLNFRNTNIIFFSLAVVSVGLYFLNYVPGYLIFTFIIVYAVILFYGCYYIGSNFFIKVVCSLKTTEKVIAISFDDGPDQVNTPQLLETLNENGIGAGFFCIGNKINGNQDLLKQIDDEGHIIGNHSFSHSFWFDMLSSDKMMNDLQEMNKETYKVINQKPKLFRPPYGVTNPNLKKAIIAGSFTPIGWSVRTMDTVTNDPNKLLKKALASLAPGAVYLFHDTSKATVAMLPEFLRQVKLNGYTIIRPDKLLNLQAYV